MSLAPPPDAGEISAAADRLETAPAAEIVRWALERFPRGRVAVVTGLQAAGVAVIDMAAAVDPEVRILTIDSGRLPAETHAYIEELRRERGWRIEVVVPDPDPIAEFVAEYGLDPFYGSVQRRLDCCHLRKVAPLDEVLTGLDCWLVGLRRNQTAGRARLRPVAVDVAHGGITKVSPVAGWDADAARTHLAARGIPLHPLYGVGYTSIGCAPCTRAVDPGEDERAGRWWWEQGIDKECGIHGRPVPITAAGAD